MVFAALLPALVPLFLTAVPALTFTLPVVLLFLLFIALLATGAVAATAARGTATAMFPALPYASTSSSFRIQKEKEHTSSPGRRGDSEARAERTCGIDDFEEAGRAGSTGADCLRIQLDRHIVLSDAHQLLQGARQIKRTFELAPLSPKFLLMVTALNEFPVPVVSMKAVPGPPPSVRDASA